MASELLVDLSKIDLSHTVVSKEGIYEVQPQRYEFEQLNGVISIDVPNGIIVGYKDVRADEFWVKGHIPGRPVMPGALLLEAAAQLCCYLYKMTIPSVKDKFVGFAGIDDARFRREVLPGNRLILIGKRLEMNARACKSKAQGVIDGKLAFECINIGMALKG